MPRRKPSEIVLSQNKGGNESEETSLTRSSVTENQPTTLEDEETGSTEAANQSTEQQITSFTPVNAASPNRSPQISTASNRPVKRLASLNISNRSTPSKVPDVQQPGASEQPKRLKVQPKSAVRRSKEEREATEKAEAERLHARLTASGTSSSLAAGRGRAQNQATSRGGYGISSRQWQSERYATSGAAGFLGGATPAEDKRRNEVASRSRGGGRKTISAGLSRGTLDAKSNLKVKKETDARKSKSRDKDGDIIMSGNGDGSIKATQMKMEHENLEDESSDDGFFALENEGKKIDIERINLVSEDEVSDGSDKGKSKVRERTSRPPGSSLMLPIRIDRHDHEDRIVTVNTEASSLTSAELRRRAKARGQAQGSLFLPETLGSIQGSTTGAKGNAKGRDVEFVRNERKWQGVYQDEDDNDDLKVKEEPKDDDDVAILDEAPSSSQTFTHDLSTHDGTSLPEDEAAPVRPRLSKKSPPVGLRPKRKSKPRGSKALKRRQPVLQTEEDHQEWQRYKGDILLLEDYLRMPSHDVQSKDLGSNTEDDTKLADVERNTIRDRKHNTSFLFQLPPILPEIIDPHTLQKGKIKRKPVEPISDVETHDISMTMKDNSKTKPNADTRSKVNTPSSSVEHKIIKSELSSTILPSSLATRNQATHALPPQPTNPLSPGRLGTIKLDSSGFPSATWTSNFRLDVGRASDYGALQEVVLLKSEVIVLPPKKEAKGLLKQEEGAFKEEGLGVSGKKAWAVGQMGGGFVVGPDWGWMFGDR